MSEVWIFNASPLIALAKIDGLKWVNQMATQILVPEAVCREIEAGPEDDPAIPFIRSPLTQRICAVPIPTNLERWGLGSGETSVIAASLAINNCRAVLDDAMARCAARAMQVPVIRTLGIILKAATRQIIPDARATIAQLRAAGLYVDERLIDQVLAGRDRL